MDKEIKIFKSDKSRRAIFILLIALSILAVIKMIFVDYTLDEEYQYVMAYRSLMGDSLFKEMWEPHQTSAFLCAGFLWLYKTVTGTLTGSMLFIRFITTLIQAGLSLFVYRFLRDFLHKDLAFCLSLLYLNISPKLIQIPEFGNMQLWFLTGLILLFSAYWKTGKKLLLLPSALCLAAEILTYPTAIILFPVCIIYLIIRSPKGKKAASSLIFTGYCAASGIIYLLLIFKNVTLDEFLMNVSNLLSFDSTHQVSGTSSSKLLSYKDNLITWGISLLIIYSVTGIITLIMWLVKHKKMEHILLSALTVSVIVSEGVQLYFWVIAQGGYEAGQVHILTLWIAGLISLKYLTKDQRKLLSFGIISTLVAYFAVMYISDLPAFYQMPHGVFGIICCMSSLLLAWKNASEPAIKGLLSPLPKILLLSFCFLCIFGKGFTVRAHSESSNTILRVEGIMKKGPCIGVMTDYIESYIYNNDFDDYNAYVPNGSNLLIVVENLQSAGTTGYMYEDNLGISHFSIVDPTTYDAKLIEYWELYPDKKPDVIIVDCWYGNLIPDSQSFIMQYIENDFGYSTYIDGKYKRFYIK